MNDDVLTRNSDGELEIRVVQTDGDHGVNQDDVFTRDNDGNLALRVTGTSGGGAGGGDVTSVNGKKGAVVLTGSDINATVDLANLNTREATTKTITEHLQTLSDYTMTLQGEIDTNAGKTAELDADVQKKVDKSQGADNAGKVLMVNSDGDVEATDFSPLPEQSGHSGVLQTDGTTASWNDNIKVSSTSILLTNTAQPAINGQIVIGKDAGGVGNSGVDNVIVGNRATAANYGIAIGADAKAQAESSIQIGAGTNTESGTFCVSTGTYPNQKNVTLLDNKGFIPSDTLADGGTEGQILSITGTGLAWTNPSVGSTDNNGLEGDYATTYGIVDETQSGLPYIKAVGSTVVVIPAGLVVDVPGQSGLTTVASTIEYELTTTNNPTLFLAQGSIIEAEDVFFQKEEPENGTTSYAAWWNGTTWQFKSNDTGNVWRAANAVRIVKTVFTGTSLTRLCFTGCRVLNKQQYIPKDTQTLNIEDDEGNRFSYNGGHLLIYSDTAANPVGEIGAQGTPLKLVYAQQINGINVPHAPATGSAPTFATTQDVVAAGLPTQAGHSGYLTTDGTTPSWSDVVPLVNQAKQSNSISIGRNNTLYFYATSIGYNAIATTQGTSLGYIAQANGIGSTALGQNAIANGANSIQIGAGTNSTVQTLQIGFGASATQNYTLLKADGTIPTGRITNSFNQELTDTNLGATMADLTPVADKVTIIEAEIPTAASADNQLADKAFVNSSINNMAAFYVTSDAAGDAFATKAALDGGPWYFQGTERTPTTNDYALVMDDETHDNKTTRYMYDGSIWAFQYVLNNTAFTQAQIDALNSGITAALVASIGDKANSATTLAGYGITDAYTKTEVNTLIQNALGSVETALATI